MKSDWNFHIPDLFFCVKALSLLKWINCLYMTSLEIVKLKVIVGWVSAAQNNLVM